MKQLNDIKSVLELLIYLKQRNIIKLYLINVWCAAHCATELFLKKLQLLIQFFIDTRPLWRNILYCEAGVRPATPEGKKKKNRAVFTDKCLLSHDRDVHIRVVAHVSSCGQSLLQEHRSCTVLLSCGQKQRVFSR